MHREREDVEALEENVKEAKEAACNATRRDAANPWTKKLDSRFVRFVRRSYGQSTY